MSNSIPADQNADRQLERLAAQRYCYTKAKRIQFWYTILSVPGVVVWSFLVLLLPSLKTYSALWGIVLTFLDVLALTPWQNTLKNRAAKIQELFDCGVLQITWNMLKVGREPDPETVAGAARSDQKEHPDFAGLKDWYPIDAGILPLKIGRVICQRANCWWDAELRRRESFLVVIVLLIVSTIVVVLSVVGDFTMERFILTGLMPLMPVVTLGLRRFGDQREAADRADRLKEAAEDLWTQAVSTLSTEEQLAYGSRQLQDGIYEHRRRSPLIPNWLYKRLRDSHEEQMNKGATALVEEASKAQVT